MKRKYMKNTYKYTVCIHCMTYNHEKYLADALEGFVMQKTNFPFVAVVIDDFSTDGTADILRQYEAKYPDIIKAVYLQENYYSQRKSKKPFLESYDSQSKYIAICEGDDYWIDPLKLQKQVDFLETHPEYAICCTRFDMYYENTGQLIHTDLYDKEEIGGNGMELTLEHLARGVVPHPHTELRRKDLLKDDDLWPKLTWNFDYPFYYCVFRCGHRVWLMNERTATYRKHEGSLTSRSSLGATKTFYMLWKEIYQYDKTPLMYELVVYHIKKLLNVYIRISKRISYSVIKDLITEFYSMRPSAKTQKEFWIKIFKAFVFRIRHNNGREDGGTMFNNQSI